MNGANTEPLASVNPSAERILSTSRTPLPMARGAKDRRRAAGRVSGWRTANHAKAIAAMARNVAKIARQLATRGSPARGRARPWE